MIRVFYDADTNQPWVVKVYPSEKNAHPKTGDNRVVQFFDGRHEHTDLGQFVSEYYMSTLLTHPRPKGLDLVGYEPSWKIRQQCMDRILTWLERLAKEDSKCQPEAS